MRPWRALVVLLVPAATLTCNAVLGIDRAELLEDAGPPPTPASCPAGLTPCPGGCFDLGADPNHCGRCDGVCVLSNASAARCESGACRFTCAQSFDDCDRLGANGCETRIDDRDNCGKCGRGCFGARCQPASAGDFDCAPVILGIQPNLSSLAVEGDFAYAGGSGTIFRYDLASGESRSLAVQGYVTLIGARGTRVIGVANGVRLDELSFDDGGVRCFVGQLTGDPNNARLELGDDGAYVSGGVGQRQAVLRYREGAYCDGGIDAAPEALVTLDAGGTLEHRGFVRTGAVFWSVNGIATDAGSVALVGVSSDGTEGAILSTSPASTNRGVARVTTDGEKVVWLARADSDAGAQLAIQEADLSCGNASCVRTIGFIDETEQPRQVAADRDFVYVAAGSLSPNEDAFLLYVRRSDGVVTRRIRAGAPSVAVAVHETSVLWAVNESIFRIAR